MHWTHSFTSIHGHITVFASNKKISISLKSYQGGVLLSIGNSFYFDSNFYSWAFLRTSSSILAAWKAGWQLNSR